MSSKSSVLIWISVGLMVVAIGCMVAFSLIGSTVDENGMVHEPFFLIPTGIITFLISSIIGIIGLVFRFKENKQASVN